MFCRPNLQQIRYIAWWVVRMMLSRLLWKFMCMRTEEYIKEYNFANVKPCNNKTKIIYCLKVKFTNSIATDTNAVQWLLA